MIPRRCDWVIDDRDGARPRDKIAGCWPGKKFSWTGFSN